MRLGTIFVTSVCLLCFLKPAAMEDVHQEPLTQVSSAEPQGQCCNVPAVPGFKDFVAETNFHLVETVCTVAPAIAFQHAGKRQ